MKNEMAIVFCAFFTLLFISACVKQVVKPNPQIQQLILNAESGNVEAQYKLGLAYDSGNGVPADGEKAEKWYLMAANAGHAEAQNSLGSVYQAVKQYGKARDWYEKAAAQNHALAINNLAYLYDLGLGVPQDRQRGYQLYLHAAELGWAEAMFNIGQMYGAGQLGDKDLLKACIWTIRAKEYAVFDREKKLSIEGVNYCKQTLSRSEYSQVERAAKAWSPSTR